MNRLGLCGTNGAKFPGIRAHMQRAIGDQYRDLDLTMESWPAEDGPRDPAAYRFGRALVVGFRFGCWCRPSLRHVGGEIDPAVALFVLLCFSLGFSCSCS